jgi:hypothetical protein
MHLPGGAKRQRTSSLLRIPCFYFYRPVCSSLIICHEGSLLGLAAICGDRYASFAPLTGRSIGWLTIARSAGAAADNCHIGAIFSPKPVSFISSQEQLDSLTRGCQRLTGDLVIAPDYTGSLVLRNIMSINGSVVADSALLRRMIIEYGSPERLPSPMPSTIPNLTSVEMPDLLSFFELVADSLPSLTSISFPKATSAGYVSIWNMTANPSLDFPALRNATEFEIVSPGFRQVELLTYTTSATNPYLQREYQPATEC